MRQLPIAANHDAEELRTSAKVLYQIDVERSPRRLLWRIIHHFVPHKVVNYPSGKPDKVPKTRMVKGVEFSDIARGPLLKLLTAYEEQLNTRIAGKKLKPIFTVQFANNKHTKKFIYPDMRKKVLPSDIRS